MDSQIKLGRLFPHNGIVKLEGDIRNVLYKLGLNMDQIDFGDYVPRYAFFYGAIPGVIFLSLVNRNSDEVVKCNIDDLYHDEHHSNGTTGNNLGVVDVNPGNGEFDALNSSWSGGEPAVSNIVRSIVDGATDTPLDSLKSNSDLTDCFSALSSIVLDERINKSERFEISINYEVINLRGIDNFLLREDITPFLIANLFHSTGRSAQIHEASQILSVSYRKLVKQVNMKLVGRAGSFSPTYQSVLYTNLPGQYLKLLLVCNYVRSIFVLFEFRKIGSERAGKYLLPVIEDYGTIEELIRMFSQNINVDIAKIMDQNKIDLYWN